MTQAATLAQLASSGALSADTSGNVTAGASITSSQSITVGTSGVYQAGSLYSDVNWGMIFRAKQASPVQAEFRWANAADTERMRIDTFGRLLVATTGSLASGYLFGTTGFLQHCVPSGAAVSMTGFYNGGNLVGEIRTSTTATAYLTSSDYRLKENIAPMTGALEAVLRLKPVTYSWKSNGEATQGFIAHELQEVVPEAVAGNKDDVDEDGNPKYQGIDTSFLVATLTAALQELKAELDVCKAEIAALKGV